MSAWARRASPATVCEHPVAVTNAVTATTAAFTTRRRIENTVPTSLNSRDSMVTAVELTKPCRVCRVAT
ncbi:hypothetical protein MMAGJ_42360 [Mycolicibacterium mageritense]|uniref:Uncharacterized protein n=1 Tax=Mycolicibacterium mageritense TaxID=53462 RepID=A0ABM7HWH2_MYCME|nr:hypothetical protein MMAGJ_42360 [Mycolicibacterium mageritense]